MGAGRLFVLCTGQPANSDSVCESVEIALKEGLAEKPAEQRWKCGEHRVLQSGDRARGESTRREGECSYVK